MPVDVQEGIALIRKHGVLEGWTDEDIHQAIHKAIKSFAFSYTTDPTGKLDGIVFGYWRSQRELHITCCIGRLSVFVKKLKESFPACDKVTGYRQGKFTEFSF